MVDQTHGLAIAAPVRPAGITGHILLGVRPFLVAEQHNGLVPILRCRPTSAWSIRAIGGRHGIQPSSLMTGCNRACWAAVDGGNQIFWEGLGTEEFSLASRRVARVSSLEELLTGHRLQDPWRADGFCSSASSSLHQGLFRISSQGSSGIGEKQGSGKRSGVLFIKVSRAWRQKGRGPVIWPQGLESQWRMEGLADGLHAVVEIAVAPPVRNCMPTSNSSKIASSETPGKHLALGILHVSHSHHLPINVAEEFNDSAFENVKCRCGHFAVRFFGIAPINQSKGKAFQGLPIDGRRGEGSPPKPPHSASGSAPQAQECDHLQRRSWRSSRPAAGDRAHCSSQLRQRPVFLLQPAQPACRCHR